MAEAIATMIFVLVVLLTAVDTEKSSFAALAIGMVIAADILTMYTVKLSTLNNFSVVLFLVRL